MAALELQQNDNAQTRAGYSTYLPPPSQPPNNPVLPPAYNQPTDIIQTYESRSSRSHPNPPSATNASRGHKLEDYYDSEYDINPYIQVDFDSVFQEPAEAGGLQIVKTINSNIYTWTKRCIYIFFTSFCGPLFAFLGGITFAITDLIGIWLMLPIIRLNYIVMRYIVSLYRPVIRTIMDPIFESFGQMFRVRNSGSFTERTYRLNISGITIGGTEAQSQPPAQHQHSS
ncbi:Caveolin-1 [Holothuria leucospilota]|uniref:Caveolin n=1 Tax=Holothuria leucospilota TaxID=206669 RepID=A0A9Q0YMG5_HOLLE|nr:Caveolin-1 [Holothuria leucospilota]